MSHLQWSEDQLTAHQAKMSRAKIARDLAAARMSSAEVALRSSLENQIVGERAVHPHGTHLAGRPVGRKTTQRGEDAGHHLLEQIRVKGMPAPAQEFQFHPTRKWRADLAWPGNKILLEIDGGIWRKGGGAHSRPTNILRDIEKSNAAVLLGYRCYRVTPDQIRNGEAIKLVERILK